jgi:beta-phosphoglucomutase-like phosphatase (HAD superfamily)
MAYQYIIFDLDGTLIDSARITGAILDQIVLAHITDLFAHVHGGRP